MQNSPPFIVYLNTPIRYYYFYLIPLVIALLIVSFDFHFQGVFPTSIASNLSSPHKFLNDFFAICTFICLALILINYFRVQLNRPQVQHIRQHYAKLNTQQRSMFNPLGLVFFIFMLLFFCLSWFLISDEIPYTNSGTKKGTTMIYLKGFAHPYISAIANSFHAAITVFFALMIPYILNVRKFK